MGVWCLVDPTWMDERPPGADIPSGVCFGHKPLGIAKRRRGSLIEAPQYR